MVTHSAVELIDRVYELRQDFLPSAPYFKERVILAPRNSDVDELNDILLDRLPTPLKSFYSFDQVVEDSATDGRLTADEVAPEYLRSMRISGYPPGELKLKLGCLLILLRNLAPERGLCNGTRMMLRHMTDRILEVQIMGGKHDGDFALIPKIKLFPQDSNSASPIIDFFRVQFPVQLALAISINKSQGQSVNVVGVDLSKPVFTHGQLYVALSRATSGRRVTVLLPEEQGYRAHNVIYPDVLLD
jgi:ATP-dependent DNA helicase PIF1